jgi:hypothetical protein
MDVTMRRRSYLTACSLGLSATSQQYFSLRTNQPPATSQQYFSLRTNQHQPSATSEPNRLHMCEETNDHVEAKRWFWSSSHVVLVREELDAFLRSAVPAWPHRSVVSRLPVRAAVPAPHRFRRSCSCCRAWGRPGTREPAQPVERHVAAPAHGLSFRSSRGAGQPICPRPQQ